MRATGTTFTVPETLVGQRLRVMAIYKDANGVLETVFSDPQVVANVNDAPTGAPTINDTTPTEGRALTVSTATIFDPDGTTAAVFTFQWQQANATGVGGGAAGFSDIVGATGQLFVPTEAQVNRELRVVVTFTDDQGTTEVVFSAPTTVVGDLFLGGAAADTWIGTDGQDIASGVAGNDLLVALGGNDILDGGVGADTIIAGAGDDTISGAIGNDQLSGEAGDDTFNYTFGDGADGVDGGVDLDTLNILGTVANNYARCHLRWNGAHQLRRWYDHRRRVGHGRSADGCRYADLCRDDGSCHRRSVGRGRIGLHLDGRHRERYRRDRRRHSDR